MNKVSEIFEKLKVDFYYNTGYIHTGLIASLSAGFASRLSEFNSKLKFIEKQAFISTADKDYLFLTTGKMLPPNPSLTAGGTVVFYGANGATVPQGTELKDDKGAYKTLSASTITSVSISGNVTIIGNIATLNYSSHELTNTKGSVNGNSKDITAVDSNNIKFNADGLTNGQAVTVIVQKALVQVQAIESGETHNRALNDALQTKTTVPNVNKDAGVILISGGKNEESLEEYRDRVLFFMSNPQAPFNNSNIRYVCMKNVGSLKYLWVRSPAEGQVEVIALNNGFSLTSDEQTKIIETTKSIAPAQMDITAISVGIPTIQNIQVVVKDLNPASDALKVEVEKNIKFLYETDTFEKGISKAKLESTIYRTANGAETVNSFILISGETISTPNVFWKYTGTTFQ